MKPLKQLGRPTNCLFVQWTKPVCRFLLLAPEKPKPQVLAAGSFASENENNLSALLNELAEQVGQKFARVVLLLPRSELDMLSLSLPPASSEELPALVQLTVSQQLDDVDGLRSIDFLQTQQLDEGQEVLAFSMDTNTLTTLKSGFQELSTRLSGVTFGGFGAVELIRRVSRHPASTAIVLTTGDQDIELVVEDSGSPMLFRTIPRSDDSKESLAQRLSEEIRRTLTLVHRNDDDSTRLYLIGGVEEHEAIAQALSDQLSMAVSVINPLDQVTSTEPIPDPSCYANLIGIGCAWQSNGLELDLLHPRRPPTNTPSWRRIAFWGGVAATLLFVAGYFVSQGRSDRLAHLAEQKTKLKSMTKRANKARELQDLADAVEKWRSDDIAWLDELRDLSERLPSYDQTLIRRMSMSTNTRQQGVIDLAVQVSEPEIVAGLEDAIRDESHSVTSKRVAETDQQSQLSWQFETRIVFSPGESPEYPQPEEANEHNSESEATDLASTPESQVEGETE